MIYSVIVTIYNVEKFLDKCISSILCQSFEDFELILVDDGSTDGCPQLCDRYASMDSRVRVIHKKNGGLVSARNIGIQSARGEYICYVDGDDWIHKNMLKYIYEKTIAYDKPDMVVYGIVKLFDDHKEEITTDLCDGLYDKNQLKEQVYPFMMYDRRKSFCKGLIFPAACNKMYKRTLLLKHFCRDERIRMGEDNAFVYECVWNADTLFICNEIFYFYSQHAGAMNHSYDTNRFVNNKILFEYMGTRLTGESEILDSQFEAFKVYWVIMAVFHEVKSGKRIFDSTKHLNHQIKETNILSYINTKGLPLTTQMYVTFLKYRFYFIVLFATKIIQSFRNI